MLKDLERKNGIANADLTGKIKITLGPWFVQVNLGHDLGENYQMEDFYIRLPRELEDKLRPLVKQKASE